MLAGASDDFEAAADPKLKEGAEEASVLAANIDEDAGVLAVAPNLMGVLGSQVLSEGGADGSFTGLAALLVPKMLGVSGCSARTGLPLASFVIRSNRLGPLDAASPVSDDVLDRPGAGLENKLALAPN